MCRVVLAAIALAYLLCLLILSGVQKEELDENTLKKLQRHNVKIDDMNSPGKKQECEYKHSALPKINTFEAVTVPTITPENSPTTTTLKNLQYDEIYKYFMQLSLTKSTTEKVTTIPSNTDDDILRDTLNLFIKSKLMNNDVNRGVVKLVGAGNMDHMLHYWKKLQKDMAAATVEEYTTKKVDVVPQNNIDLNTTPLVFVELQTSASFLYPKNYNKHAQGKIETFNKLISEYMSRENYDTTTLTPTPTAQLVDIIEQINNFLRHNLTHHQNGNHHGVQKEIAKLISQEIVPSTEKPLMMEQLSFPDFVYQKYTNSNAASKQNSKLIVDNAYIDDKQSNDNRNIIVSALSNNAIAKITEEIKQKIFKDFYEELMPSTILTTTTTTTSTTTTTAPTTTPTTTTTTPTTTTTTTTTLSPTTKEIPTTTKQAKKNDMNAEKVLENLMAMFQEFKTIKESAHIQKDTVNKLAKKRTDLRHKKKYKPKQAIARNKIHRQQSKVAQVPTLRVIQPPYSVLKTQNIEQKTPAPIRKVEPITLQTNSNEVPPLVVALPQQFNIIRQNIVITTTSASTILANERDYWSHGVVNDSSPLKQPTFANTKPPTVRIYKISNPEVKFKKRKQVSSLLHKDRVRYEPHNTAIPFIQTYPNFDRDKWNEKQETKMPFDFPKFETKLKHDLEQFHELIGVNTNNDEASLKQSSYFVAARQVKPINAQKLEYDDAHYERLIKTQERVNEMLEQMLASKSHHSFEVETDSLHIP